MNSSIKTRVSVVISAYNAAQWIGNTIESVIAQTFRDFEIIVVDAGSSDNTIDIVSRYGSKVRLIAPGRCSKSIGKNIGIKACIGEYVAFVDADDLWLPKKLELQLQEMINFPSVTWVYSDGYLFEDSTGRTITSFGRVARLHEGEILKSLLLYDFIPSPTPIIRKSALDRVGYFDEGLERYHAEDWDLWLRLAANFPIRLVNAPLVRYRVHAGSLTAKEDPELAFRGQLEIVERAVARNPRQLNPLRSRAIANCYVRQAGFFARAGCWVKARRAFRSAICLSPLLARAHAGWVTCVFGGGLWRLAFDMRRRLFFR